MLRKGDHSDHLQMTGSALADHAGWFRVVGLMAGSAGLLRVV